MKIAVVHDWFSANGGAEKVAGAILDCFAGHSLDVYTLFNAFKGSDKESILRQYAIHTSVLQHIPGINSHYRLFFPLMPIIIEHMTIKHKDLILSTSHAVAKGISYTPGTLHICYCHTPMRYAWDMYDEYLADHGLKNSYLYARLMEYMRQWDVKTASKVHYFIANSRHIAQRIKKCYNREAKVIYPPVRVDTFPLNTEQRQDYYLCLGRFVPYKKIDLIVKAFRQMPDKKLYLIGAGYATQQFNALVADAPNIQHLGFLSDEAMIGYIAHAKACIFAAKEDFGIQCVEVQACGTPVIALRYGGYLETVVEHQTGYFFEEQTEESLTATVHAFESNPLTEHARIREHALQFSVERFNDEMQQFVRECYTSFYQKPF